MFPLPVTGLFGKLNITLCACMRVNVRARTRVCVCACSHGVLCTVSIIAESRKGPVIPLKWMQRCVHTVDLHLAVINTEGVQCVHVIQ